MPEPRQLLLGRPTRSSGRIRLYSPVEFRSAVMLGLRPSGFLGRISDSGERAKAAARWEHAVLTDATHDWAVCAECESQVETVLQSRPDSHSSALLSAIFVLVSFFIAYRLLGPEPAAAFWVCGAIVALVLGVKTFVLHKRNQLRSLVLKVRANNPERRVAVAQAAPAEFMPRAEEIAQQLNSWKFADGPEALKKTTDAAETLGREIYDLGGKALIVQILNKLKADGHYAGALEKEWEAFFY